MTIEIRPDLKKAVEELLEQAQLKAGDIFVLGGSSSEVIGGTIGQDSSPMIGEMVVSTILDILDERGIYLAVQGCEHINRALVIEREIAEKKGYEIVSVIPQHNAGGSFSVAAYHQLADPVMIEHVVGQAGIDIGDTEIGMHIKHVQVPVRLEIKYIGDARLTALRSRPKLIGGDRSLHD